MGETCPKLVGRQRRRGGFVALLYELMPQVGLDMAAVLRRVGYEVAFPEEQTCCGQPGFNSGYWNDARPLAERFLRVFRDCELIVAPSGSCTTMVRVFYPQLLADSPLAGEATQIGKRTFEFSEFM